MLDIADAPYVPAENETPRSSRQEVQKAYNEYFMTLNSNLIVDIPMLTYEKTRYAVGDRLELLPKGSKPPSRGLFTVNAWMITNIATRLGQQGFYTRAEEQLEAEKEKLMVFPSLQYGSRVNQNARPDQETLDEAKRSQIRAAKAIRDVSIYGKSSIHSGRFKKVIWSNSN